MQIVGLEKLEKFKQEHPNTKSSIERWITLIVENNFGSVVELRQIFPHADLVPGQTGEFQQGNRKIKLTVFNIGGNKARLTAFLNYKEQRLFVRKIQTHAEYDK